MHLQESEERLHDRVREHDVLSAVFAHGGVHRNLESIEDQRHEAKNWMTLQHLMNSSWCMNEPLW